MAQTQEESRQHHLHVNAIQKTSASYESLVSDIPHLSPLLDWHLAECPQGSVSQMNRRYS